MMVEEGGGEVRKGDWRGWTWWMCCDGGRSGWPQEAARVGNQRA